MNSSDLTATNPLSLDFTNSFVCWWMDSVNHSPRCALRARCKIETGKKEEIFYLTHACAGENMYVTRNLIQQPTAEFHLIFSEAGEILTVKFFDRGNDNIRSVVRVGVPFEASVNRGCTITRLEKKLRKLRQCLLPKPKQRLRQKLRWNKQTWQPRLAIRKL